MDKETVERLGKILMAMTETEAAALAMLDVIDREREALRNMIENGRDST